MSNTVQLLKADALDPITQALTAQTAADRQAADAAAQTATVKAGEASDDATAAEAARAAAVVAKNAAEAAQGVATTQATTATTQAGIATTQAGIATTQASTATSQAGVATTQAGIATTQAGIATTQAGIATTKAQEAAASASTAANVLSGQYKGGVAGNSVPATATAAGAYYDITADGTSQSISWITGDRAVYNGTSGSWTRVPLGAYFGGYVTTRTNSRKSSQAWVFDGTAGATISGLTANGTANETWWCVIRPDILPAYGTIIDGAAGSEYWYYNNAGMMWFIKRGTAVPFDSVPNAIEAGKTQCFAVVKNGSSWVLYKNGVSIATATNATDFTAAPTAIGATVPASLEATIGSLVVGKVNAALSAAEVATLAETGRLPSWCHSAQVGQPAGVNLVLGAAPEYTTSIRKGYYYDYTFTVSDFAATSVRLGDGVTYQRTVTANGTYTGQFLCTGTAFNFSIVGGTATITGVRCTPLGSVLNLDPDQRGLGSTWYNTNGTGDATRPASGVTWAVPASYNLSLGGGAALLGSSTGEIALSNATDSTVSVKRIASNTARLTFQDSTGSNIYAQYDAYRHVWMSGGTERMRLFETTGNLALGTTSDAGYKLDVNGTMRVLGSVFRMDANGASIQVKGTGTGQKFVQVGNTGADLYVGVESSTAGAFFPGSGAYEPTWYAPGLSSVFNTSIARFTGVTKVGGGSNVLLKSEADGTTGYFSSRNAADTDYTALSLIGNGISLRRRNGVNSSVEAIGIGTDGAVTFASSLTAAGAITQSGNGIGLDGLAATRTVGQAVVYGGVAGDQVYGLVAPGTSGVTFTLRFLVPSVNPAANQMLLSRFGVPNSPYNDIFVWVGTNGNLTINPRYSGADHVLTPLNIVSLYGGKFVRVDLVLDGTNLTTYLNGAQVSQNAIAHNLTGATACYIGSDYNGTSLPFTGPLVVNEILGASTAAEIAAAHRGQYPRWWFPTIGPAGVPIARSGGATWSSDSTATLSNLTAQTVTWTDTNNGYCYTAPGDGLRSIPQGHKITATVTVANLVGTVTASIATVGTGGADGAGITLTNGVNTLPAGTAGSGGCFISLGWSAASSGDITACTYTPLGAQFFQDASQPGVGNIIRSVGTIPGYAVKSASNSWLIPSSQLERADVLTRTQSNARRQLIQLSGSQGRSTATLGFDIGTAPFEVFTEFDVPSVNPSAVQGLVLLSSGGAIANPYGARLYFLTDGSLNFVINGATDNTNNRIASIANFRALYSGQRVRLEVQRSSSGLTITCNGAALSYTESTGGTPPAWTGSVLSTYLDVGTLGTSSLPFSGSLTASLLLGNLTAAESARWHATGEWPQWVFVSGGAGTALITGDNSTFASDTGWWGKNLTASIAAGSATLNAGDSIYRNGLLVSGKKYRGTVTFTTTGGTAQYYNGSAYVNIASTSGTHYFEFTALGTDFYLKALAAQVVFDTAELTPLGLAFHPSETWDGRGGIWPDVSGAGRHLTLATSGMTAAVQSVRGEVAANIYAPGREVLSVQMTSGTAYTADQVLAEVQGANYAPMAGRWMLVGGAGIRYFNGGYFGDGGFNGNQLAEEGSGGGLLGAYGLNAYLKVVAGAGNLSCKLQICAKQSLTQASTVTVRAYHLDGIIDRALVK